MELKKNQSKWNITSIDDHDLYRILSAIGHYNQEHIKVGRGDVFVDIKCEDINIVPESFNRDNLLTLKVLNTGKKNTDINGTEEVLS